MDNSTVITVFSVVGFISSLVSLVVSVGAILLTLHFKSESDKVNTDTRNLLIDIKTDAKSLTSVASTAMGELTEYGKTSRELTLQLVSGRMHNFSTGAPSGGADAEPEPRISTPEEAA